MMNLIPATQMLNSPNLISSDINLLILFIVLFLTGMIAGWVNAIAGGGGLITLPVFLAIGVPPQYALGTNKCQASIGSATATFYYVQGELASVRQAWPGIVSTFIGAVCGSILVTQMRPDILNEIIPWLMLGTFLYVIVTPKLGIHTRKPKMSQPVFMVIFGLAFGFYDGFYGPGVGSFWIFAFVLALGFDLAKANGYAKLLNLTSNIVTFIVFLMAGFVWFSYALVMAAGQYFGARLGATRVLKNGARFVRPIFIAMVAASTLKFFYDRYWSTLF
jgi:uncharacterized membrane protein YfcA